MPDDERAMTKMRLIEMPHKVCGVTCMVNGLEDLYEHHTGVCLPDCFFFI